MAIAKVIEVISEGKTFEEAMESAVSEAQKTVRDIKHVYVEGIQALIEEGKIAKYRVNAKVTFVIED
jgi:flavin-binding protein dodecin